MLIYIKPKQGLPTKGDKVPVFLCPEHSHDCSDLAYHDESGWHGEKREWYPEDAVTEWVATI
jgi:hypothetical protein